jgi:hypothetical protein
MANPIGKKRIPVAITFFILGWFVIIASAFAPIAPEGILAGQLTIGGGESIPVNSFLFIGIAMIGVGIVIFIQFKPKKGK